MDIQYLGHSCFKIRAKSGSVVCDPYDSEIGFTLPSVSADIVTISHDHSDHSNSSAVSGTARRKKPFVISEPGEYEIEGISIFGYGTYHDEKKGEERGRNTIFVYQVEGLRVLHLGDLGHVLDDKLIEELNGVDILLIPVGGVYTIDAKVALRLIEALNPSIAVPMHYRTEKHDAKVFGELIDLDDFLKAYEGEARKVEDKLAVSKLSLSEDSTEVVVFV